MRWALPALIGGAVLSIAVLVHGMTLDYRYDPKNYPAMAKWAGCHAQVAVSTNMSPARSRYFVEDHILLIGTRDDLDVPYWAGLMILFHEVGHCLQAEQGRLGPLFEAGGYQAIELDADRQSADLACGLGLDGRRLLHDLFIWARDTFGYQGDWQHGSLEQRIAQGDKAARCLVVAPQS